MNQRQRPRSGARLRLGLAVSALTAAAVVAACAPGVDEGPWNVVLVSLDTTRRDHLSLYGYSRETSPHLEELGARSAVFTQATAQMTITNPSHATIFTGLYPHTHGVGENTRELADRFVTLTEMLGASGYRSGGFVSGHPLRPQITGLDQGFDTYDGELRRRRDGRDTLDRALAWLRGLEGDEPFFLFVHFYDAHGPFRPPERYLELFRSPEPGRSLEFVPQYQRIRGEDGTVVRDLAAYVDRYDALLRYQDDLLGELLAELDLERTLVVVVADHGETLGDRAEPLNLNHGTSVFEEQVAVPLVLHVPGGPSGVFDRPVETVDIVPTLVELLGLETPEELAFEGESMAPIVRGRADESVPSFAFASNRARSQNHSDRGYELRKRDFMHSVRDRRWKLIEYPGVERDYLELYDLEADPAERFEIGTEHPEVREALLATLETWRASGKAPELDGEVDAEDLEQLRALGYVDDDSD
ncbi:MAG TPA: sulfatase-like hydrolase/transferase [Thermoanaerobaculia bacterium]|nr:sulfatase-like hydrolase/transferase [Thermoanaerobaculia bacterium]